MECSTSQHFWPFQCLYQTVQSEDINLEHTVRRSRSKRLWPNVTWGVAECDIGQVTRAKISPISHSAVLRVIWQWCFGWPAFMAHESKYHSGAATECDMKVIFCKCTAGSPIIVGTSLYHTMIFLMLSQHRDSVFFGASRAGTLTPQPLLLPPTCSCSARARKAASRSWATLASPV